MSVVLEMLFLQKWKRISFSKFFLLLFLFFGVLYFIGVITKETPSFWNVQQKEVSGTVVRVRKKEYGIEVWIRSSSKDRLRVFYQGNQNIQLGDQILVKGEFQKPKRNTIPNAFNYAYYLWYHRESYIFEAKSIQVIGQTKNFILRIKSAMDKEISKRRNAKYLKLFLLGQNDAMGSEQESFRINGISHLFSISGMHFSFLASFISKIFLKKRKDSLFSFSIMTFLLFLYLVLIDFLPSACRAFLFFEFVTVTRIRKWDFSKSYCFWLMISIILFWKPFYFFDVGFQFSVVLNFFLCQKNFNTNAPKIFQAFSLSVFTFFVSLPIVLFYFHKVNFLSIIWNIFFVPFVSIFFFPIQILSFFLPFLSPVAFYVGFFFEKSLSLISTLDFLIISFHSPPLIWVLLYYTLLLFSCSKYYLKRGVFGLLFLILVLYHWNFIFLKSYFLMIDVGQGDCLLFHSHNRSMLVDTGGNFLMGEGKIYLNKLKPLLESLGIRRIDILCLSHGDFDHIGEAYSLIQDMKVGHVYFNMGDFTIIERKILKLLVQKKISYSILQEGESFRLGQFSFYSLNQSFPLENDSSSVLLGTIQNYFFLLTGDATKQTEQYIINTYQLPELLFLKIGHHGSNTSSSLDLVKTTKPKYSLISVGVNNRYGHPDLEVIRRLNQYSNHVYMTSVSGSILINFKKNVTFSFFPP